MGSGTSKASDKNEDEQKATSNRSSPRPPQPPSAAKDGTSKASPRPNGAPNSGGAGGGRAQKPSKKFVSTASRSEKFDYNEFLQTAQTGSGNLAGPGVRHEDSFESPASPVRAVPLGSHLINEGIGPIEQNGDTHAGSGGGDGTVSTSAVNSSRPSLTHTSNLMSVNSSIVGPMSKTVQSSSTVVVGQGATSVPIINARQATKMLPPAVASGGCDGDTHSQQSDGLPRQRPSILMGKEKRTSTSTTASGMSNLSSQQAPLSPTSIFSCNSSNLAQRRKGNGGGGAVAFSSSFATDCSTPSSPTHAMQRTASNSSQMLPPMINTDGTSMSSMRSTRMASPPSRSPISGQSSAFSATPRRLSNNRSPAGDSRSRASLSAAANGHPFPSPYQSGPRLSAIVMVDSSSSYGPEPDDGSELSHGRLHRRRRSSSAGTERRKQSDGRPITPSGMSSHSFFLPDDVPSKPLDVQTHQLQALFHSQYISPNGSITHCFSNSSSVLSAGGGVLAAAAGSQTSTTEDSSVLVGLQPPLMTRVQFQAPPKKGGGPLSSGNDGSTNSSSSNNLKPSTSGSIKETKDFQHSSRSTSPVALRSPRGSRCAVDPASPAHRVQAMATTDVGPQSMLKPPPLTEVEIAPFHPSSTDGDDSVLLSPIALNGPLALLERDGGSQ